MHILDFDYNSSDDESLDNEDDYEHNNAHYNPDEVEEVTIDNIDNEELFTKSIYNNVNATNIIQYNTYNGTSSDLHDMTHLNTNEPSPQYSQSNLGNTENNNITYNVTKSIQNSKLIDYKQYNEQEYVNLLLKIGL